MISESLAGCYRRSRLLSRMRFLCSQLLLGQDMVIRILNGGRNMPAFGGILHPDQVSDLVAYLETRRLHPGPDLSQAP